MRSDVGRATSSPDEGITVGDAAAVCGCHRDAIHDAIKSRRLRSRRRADGRRVADLADVLAFRRLLWGAR